MINKIIIGLLFNSALQLNFVPNTNEVETTLTETTISSGKIVYLPGNVCNLKPSYEFDIEKTSQFADACEKLDENWFLISNVEASYKHESAPL
tara:strand:- start:6591 stop:6869 length:279 start_codon:yes stop_codon:yes gene_type:complete